MASKTSFLQMTLPENGEFVDQWDAPLNGNFEIIDDHIKALDEDLVDTGGDTANLKGSTASLQARLDAGLNADGTLKLSNASDYTVLEKSKHYPLSGATDQIQRIIDRMDVSELELVKLRFGQPLDRYTDSTLPEAVVGVSRLASMYRNSPATDAIQSPIRGFAPHSVVDGPLTAGPPTAPDHFESGAGDEAGVKTGSIGATYNIDGLYFRVPGDIDLDLGVSGHNLAGTGTHHVFMSRNAADYNSASSLQWYYRTYHGQSLGGPKRLDPRIVPTHAGLRADADSYTYPTDGSVTAGTSQLTSASGAFSTWGAEAGNLLVITSPATLAGEYAIESVGATTVNIYGQFRATSAAITHHVKNPQFPSFGFETVIDTQPATAGRLYIGKFVVAAGTVTGVTPYAYSGIYDSGWIPFASAFGVDRKHYLGVPPSQMEVWVRDTSATPDVHQLDPHLLLNIQHVDVAGGSTYTAEDIPFPAFKHKATPDEWRVETLATKASTAYTDFAGVDVSDSSANHDLRVILRR